MPDEQKNEKFKSPQEKALECRSNPIFQELFHKEHTYSPEEFNERLEILGLNNIQELEDLLEILNDPEKKVEAAHICLSGLLDGKYRGQDLEFLSAIDKATLVDNHYNVEDIDETAYGYGHWVHTSTESDKNNERTVNVRKRVVESVRLLEAGSKDDTNLIKLAAVEKVLITHWELE